MALYYTLADVVLIGQCFYYRGFTLSDRTSEPVSSLVTANAHDRSPLLNGTSHLHCHSSISYHESNKSDTTHIFSPTLLTDSSKLLGTPATSVLKSGNRFRTASLNALAVCTVCATGVFGWWVGRQSDRPLNDQTPSEKGRIQEEKLHLNVVGQIFGYLCAIFYLGSRLPQIWLNYRRKSTEGISILFFLFACMGNVTYVLSILAFSPICRNPRHCAVGEARDIYARYILVNTSWLLGSIGTLLLDLGIFVQFFIYRSVPATANEDAVADAIVSPLARSRPRADP